MAYDDNITPVEDPEPIEDPSQPLDGPGATTPDPEPELDPDYGREPETDPDDNFTEEKEMSAHDNTYSEKPVIAKRHFVDANDKNVAAVIVFLNSNKYYYDEEFKKEVTNEEMLHLFFTGVVLSKNGTFYKPVSCTEAGVINFGV